MKIIDTTTFYEENMIMDIRFNILDPYIDKFIVCESLFTHSGNKKKINFNLNKYPKFKDKIIHLVLDREPADIIKKENLSPQEKRLNSIYRIREQRNYIQTVLDQFSDEDYIIYSDNDEIPNLEKFDLSLSKKKFLIFNQKLFYYKLNLSLPDLKWFGSKACKLKYLKNIDYLRNIKNKNYSFFRIDTLFSDIKQNSVEIVSDGGWHFSNLKSYEDLEKKYLNDENHAEYELQKSSKKKILDNIKKQIVPYNYLAKKGSQDRFKETKLIKVDTSLLPQYLRKNIDKFNDWIIK
jgi:beta-1,4-mannosyl-glycoprotein beta-1,4-N-acetylglucosaminyltransferase